MPSSYKKRRIHKTKQEEPIEEFTECAICYEKMSKETMKTLPCNHKFHTKCVNKWLQNNTTCPLCRNIEMPLFRKRRIEVETAERQRGIVPFLGVVVCYKNKIIGKHLNTELNLRTENTLGDLQNAVIEKYQEWANSGICQRVAGRITNALYGTSKNRFSCVPVVMRLYQGTPSNCNLMTYGSIYNVETENDVPLHIDYELYQHNAMETYNNSISAIERRNVGNVLMAHSDGDYEFDFFYNENNPIVAEENRDHDAVEYAIENPDVADVALRSTTHSLSWIVIELGYRNENRGGKRRRTRKNKRRI
jgi:hypothetical protein